MQQFTDKAKVALQKAAKAAKDLHQSYIGSEHILVGLVRKRQVLQRECSRRTVWMRCSLSV